MDVSSKKLMMNDHSDTVMMSIPDIIPSNVVNGVKMNGINNGDKSIMNGIKMNGISNGDKSVMNGNKLKKSSSSIHLEVEIGTIESMKKNPILLPTSSSYNHLATMMGDHCISNVRKTMSNRRMDQVPNVCDGDEEEVFNSLIPVRTRTGTADGSTQTSRSHHRSGGSIIHGSIIHGSNIHGSIIHGKHHPLMHESSSMDRSEFDYSDRKYHENTEVDGGFWAWIVVLGAFLTNGIIFGVINCFGVIFKQIQDKFSTDGDTSSFLTCKYQSSLFRSIFLRSIYFIQYFLFNIFFHSHIFISFNFFIRYIFVSIFFIPTFFHSFNFFHSHISFNVFSFNIFFIHTFFHSFLDVRILFLLSFVLIGLFFIPLSLSLF